MNETLPGMLLACTLRGTLLIALAMLAGPWARRLLGRNGAHWLWVAVLPALLWPLPPHTPFSLRNLWPAHSHPSPMAQAPGIVAPAEDDAPLIIKVRNLESAAPVAPSAARVEKAVTGESFTTAPPRMAAWGHWAIGVWLLGVGISVGHLSWRWRGTLRLLHDARPIHDARAMAILERFARSGRVSLAVTSRVRAPALAGIWRPRILLPEDWLTKLSTEELESVLLHELGHHRRGDLIWEWLYAIARCLHWMNPAVWLAERMARQERELACDAWALARSESPERYGEALLEALKLMQRGPAATVGIAAMAGDARQIARRLEWIARDHSAPRWLAATAWAPALLFLVAVGSDPVAAQTREPQKAPSAPADPGNANRLEKNVDDDEPLPLAKRSVELRTRILRVPESIAKALGWPIAEEKSKGVQRVLSREEFRRIHATLQATPEVEILPGPRLIARSGQPAQFHTVREFRYGSGYNAAPGGTLVPSSIETTDLGLSLESQAEIKDPSTVQVDFKADLTRLTGFENADGTRTGLPASPPGTNWMHRLVSYEMPVGTPGAPSFSAQRADVHLGLNTSQVAVVFGFRDVDRVPPPGATKEQTMINYFAVQIDIAP